uniref:Uncharacterized protein n=1 Tax=Coccidioides posadasii RMSCC 3488 TaxID=454284 RepID=A0A0J6FBN5_COCPO|nr:hypothetical protein CPAG_02993 [Coccidioides posadasii RMSCC 3488]
MTIIGGQCSIQNIDERIASRILYPLLEVSQIGTARFFADDPQLRRSGSCLGHQHVAPTQSPKDGYIVLIHGICAEGPFASCCLCLKPNFLSWSSIRQHSSLSTPGSTSWCSLYAVQPPHSSPMAVAFVKCPSREDHSSSDTKFHAISVSGYTEIGT